MLKHVLQRAARRLSMAIEGEHVPSTPTVYDNRTSRGVADRPASVGQVTTLPRVESGALAYGVSPSTRGDCAAPENARADVSTSDAPGSIAPHVQAGDDGRLLAERSRR